MKTPAHYAPDVLFFFDGKPAELALYETLFRHMEEVFPDASVKVQKSQISFYGRHLFGAVSLPVRRKKNWPEHCIVVTIGLSHPLESPPGPPCPWSRTLAAGPTMCLFRKHLKSMKNCWSG